MDSYGIGEIVQSHDITLFDTSALGYSFMERVGENRFYTHSLLHKKRYEDHLITIFEENPQTYVTHGVYKEFSKGVRKFSPISPKKYTDSHASILKQLKTALSKGHVLNLPEDDLPVQNALRVLPDIFSGLVDLYNLSKVDFELAISTLTCSCYIGNTALLTDDMNLARMCVRGYNDLRANNNFSVEYNLDLYTRNRNRDVFRRFHQ